MNDFDTIMSCLNEFFPKLNLMQSINVREFVHIEIDKKKDIMREDFKKRIMKEAAELGIDLNLESPKIVHKIQVPKYRDPANPDITWSGRGKRPTWLIDLLATGITLESLLIQTDSKVDTEVGF